MSSSPPAFNPPRSTPSGSKLWMWVIIAVVAFCLIACGIGAFFLKGAVDTIVPVGGCMLTGELVTKATLAYAIENDGRLPNAETWQDDIQPYYERLYDKAQTEMEDVPDFFNVEVSRPGAIFECKLKGGRNTGFVFNAELSDVLVDDVENPASVILIFESWQYGYNASADPSMRADDEPVLIFGDERPWIDIYVTGHVDTMQSSNDDFNMEITIEDALGNPEPESDEPE